MKLVCAVKNRNPRGRCDRRSRYTAAVASARAPALPHAPRPRAGPVDRGIEGPSGPAGSGPPTVRRLVHSYGPGVDRTAAVRRPRGPCGAATQLRAATQLQLRGDVATAVLSRPCGSPCRAGWATLFAACLHSLPPA